jgi:hypothetical protein
MHLASNKNEALVVYSMHLTPKGSSPCRQPTRAPSIHCQPSKPTLSATQIYTVSHPSLHCQPPKPTLSTTQAYTVNHPSLQCQPPKPVLKCVCLCTRVYSCAATNFKSLPREGVTQVYPLSLATSSRPSSLPRISLRNIVRTGEVCMDITQTTIRIRIIRIMITIRTEYGDSFS